MNLFGLEGIGFIISLAMTLLVSGAIMFYCLRRFKILENSIVEQGKVLQSFIIKYQNNFNTELASPIALDSAIKQSKLQSEFNNSKDSKIEVSDDDESEYSEEDSEEEELEIYPETEQKEITLTTQELDIGGLDNIEQVNLDGEDIKTVEVADITDLLITTQNDKNDKNDKNDSGDESDQDSDDSDVESIKQDERLEEVTDVKLEKINPDDNAKKTSNKSLSKMKVDDLRVLALKDSLETADNLKNMKKDQLLKLFNKN